MLTVDDARARILADATPLGAETVPLGLARGRVLARDVIARRTQPPQAMSAMDGWALRSTDLANGRRSFRVVGEARAGQGFDGDVGTGEAVRIFTGAPVPTGADLVVIQEDTRITSHHEDGTPAAMYITGEHPDMESGDNIRPAGIDFQTGAVGLQAGRELEARAIALAAAMGHPWLPVHRRPRVALLATGDELARPGEPLGPDSIVDAVSPCLTALFTDAGADVVDLGIAPDIRDQIDAQIATARGADLLVTIGGASVGDHDLVQAALVAAGAGIDFWKIAMRPGKPLMYGRLDGMPVLGLPGNPVSAYVCSVLFALPLIDRLAGRAPRAAASERLPLAAPIAANAMRQHYMRARLLCEPNGQATVLPVRDQDSSLLSALADADVLILRRPHAAAAEPGELVDVLRLDRLG
ncbi:molybdopterin molybdotransferase MoeA [Tistrella mobilis]|uniref:molybdopterin molybdotransferase MoeA n=1 Tax=Tistrella mobilis TaxID=171437 RepID=UPI0035579724